MGSEVLLIHEPVNLAKTQNAVLTGTGARLAGSGVRATIMHAALVGDSVTSTVICDAHVDLLRVNVARPK